MTEDDRAGPAWCETVRDRLPDHIAGRLSDEAGAAVELHLTGCPQCAAEAEVVAAVLRERASPPRELAGRIQDAVRRKLASEEASGPWPGRAALLVAAVLAAVLGGALFWQAELADHASLTGAGEAGADPAPWVSSVFPSDDGVLAGAPVLEGLSDDALERLIEEMEG